MKRNRWAGLLLVIAMVAGLLFPAVSIFGQITNSPKLGTISNSDLYGVNVGPGERAKVGSNVSGATQFNCTSLIGRGDDFYNTGFKYRVIKATNITAGTIGDITDYISSSGTFTVVTPGANWASGDWIEIISDEVAAQVFGYGDGAVVTGVITTYTNTTTFTVASFAGMNSTLMSVTDGGQPKYVIRVDQFDDTNDSTLLGQWRALFSISAAGVCVVSPGFASDDGTTDLLDAGETVSIVPMDYINPPNSCRWQEQALTGGSGSVTLAGLIGKPSTFIPVGSFIKCINDASAATNDGSVSYVTGFTSATGAVTFSPVHTAAIRDLYVIEWGAAVDYFYGNAVASGAPKAIQSTMTAITAGGGATPGALATATTAITGAAVGAVNIESVSIQVHDAAEGAGITSVWLVSDDTKPLNQQFLDADGNPLTSAKLVQGVRYFLKVDHLLASGKKLYLAPIGAAGAQGATCIWTVDIVYRANAGAATLAGV